MKHTVIGMAGHIDHGKTALIRALTSIETDRLPEERERGITIDLGFAYWKENVTIIDVPGHEKFIRNMVAGVSTVDLFLLVIAADDGIMPQTREHLEILKFFNVRQGVVAVNKIDTVDQDWLELVQEEVKSFLISNQYEKVPVISVSALSGQGIDELRQVISEKIDMLHENKSDRPFRLNIDRSFYSKGFGSVITGTVLSAQTEVDSNLIVLPEKIETKVRGLEIHQKSVLQVHEGQRAAVNLSGLNKQQLQRGQVLVESGSLKPCTELLVKINTTALFKFKIKRLSEVRVHLGTAEVKGTLNWFELDTSLKNEGAYHIHLKLSEPSVAAPGDPVLLRSYSPVTTIAGGKVLQINPPKLKRNNENWKKYFAILNEGSLTDRVKLFFNYADNLPYSKQELSPLFFEDSIKIEQILDKLKKQKILTKLEYNGQTYYLLIKTADKLADKLALELEQLAAQGKMTKGYNFKEIQNLFASSTRSELFLKYVLQKAVRTGKVTYDGLSYFAASAQTEQEVHKLQQQLVHVYLQKRFTPPDFNDLCVDMKVSKNQLSSLIQDLLRDKILVSINGIFYLHTSVFEEFLSFLDKQFKRKEVLDIMVAREFTKSSRKYIIPLLEFTDREGHTVRDGDVRYRGEKLNG